MQRRWFALALAVATLAACSKPDAPPPLPAPPPPPLPVERKLDVAQLPPLKYAGVVFEARSGVIAPDGAQATATLVVQATAPSKAEVPLDGQLTLAFANGTQLRKQLQGFGSAQVADLTLSGNAPAGTTWDGATLTVTESGKPPQRVTVGQPAPATRVLLTPSGEAVAPSRYRDPITSQVAQAALELDGPRSGGFFERTADNLRFARVRVTVLNKGARSGVSIGQESFELRVDGHSMNVAVGLFARAIAFNQSADFELVYRVPVAAQKFVLIVGADGKKPGEIELTRSP
ncbi:MAG: hypothetical protein U5L03_01320 [Burkholderiaceae bacterium]|nr:hypothetical protein [Burkholderiaceae bacterium]